MFRHKHHSTIYYTSAARWVGKFSSLKCEFRRLGVRLQPAGRPKSKSFILIGNKEEVPRITQYNSIAVLVTQTEFTIFTKDTTTTIQGVTTPKDICKTILDHLPNDTGIMKAWSPTLWADVVRDKTVAIIGSADSLNNSQHGPEIDSADLVVRMSHSALAENKPEMSWGKRTDIVVLNSSAYRSFLKAPDLASDAEVYYLLSFGKYLPKAYQRQIPDPRDPDKTLDIHPMLGTILTHYSLEGGAAEVRVYGMDFFRTSDPFALRRGEPCPIRYSGSKKCHHHGIDEDFLRSYLDHPNFFPDPLLRSILDGTYKNEKA